MNALFLKDLAEKTHRGLRGRVEDGKSGGGLCYGYRVVHDAGTAGAVTTGEREIDPDRGCRRRADLPRRSSPVSRPKPIAKTLNRKASAGRSAGAGARARFTATPAAAPAS